MRQRGSWPVLALWFGQSRHTSGDSIPRSLRPNIMGGVQWERWSQLLVVFTSLLSFSPPFISQVMAFVQTESFDTPSLSLASRSKPYKNSTSPLSSLRLHLLHSTVKAWIGGDGDLLHVLEIWDTRLVTRFSSSKRPGESYPPIVLGLVTVEYQNERAGLSKRAIIPIPMVVFLEPGASHQGTWPLFGIPGNCPILCFW